MNFFVVEVLLLLLLLKCVVARSKTAASAYVTKVLGFCLCFVHKLRRTEYRTGTCPCSVSHRSAAYEALEMDGGSCPSLFHVYFLQIYCVYDTRDSRVILLMGEEARV